MDTIDQSSSENQVFGRKVTVRYAILLKKIKISFPILLLLTFFLTSSITAQSSYTITASAGNHGTIYPSGVISVSPGSRIFFTITPDPGSIIRDVVVDSVSLGPINNYIFSNVTSNHTISVSFSVTTYSITATVGAHGTISPPSSPTISYGGSQHFSITPDLGYYVDSLIIDGVRIASDTQYTFTNITSNHTLRSTFAIMTYPITSTAGPNGTITPSPVAIVNYGARQHFSIVPNVHYHVDSLIVDGVWIASDTQYSFVNVRASHSIRATFAIDTYTIVASVSGSGGRISPPGSISVPWDSVVIYTITPDPGQSVHDVLVDGVSHGPIDGYTFIHVNANHTITASFSFTTYTITSSSGVNGTISPTPTVLLRMGDSQHFSITPNTGYHVDSLLIDGVGIDPDTQYTFTNVNSNHTIRATFAINIYTIASSAGAHGTISPTPMVTVNYGGSQHFSIATEIGYHIDSLIIDGVKIASDTQYTFSSVKSNHTIRAIFSHNDFTITSSAGLHGAISPAPSVFVSMGASQYFSITPDSGYHVDSLVIDGVKIASDTQYTFTNVNSDHTIRASFAINIYSIRSSAGAHGTISPTPIATVTYGGSQHFSITSNTGYRVDSLVIDGVVIAPDTQYSFDNVTADHTIRATFTLDVYSITASVPGSGGTINPSGSVTVASGGRKIFSITADQGHDINDVLVDNVSQGPLSSYTFTHVTSNHSISASFSLKSYTISSVSGAHGTISPAPTATVYYGDTQHFSITPDTGYHVDSLIIDRVRITPDTQYTFNNISSAHTIRATFAINIYAISSSAGANGTISPTPTAMVTYGGSQHFSILPNTNYHVDSLIIDGLSASSDTEYTFNGVVNNHTIRATFSYNDYTITSSAGANGTIFPTPLVYLSRGNNQHFNIIPNTGYHVDSLIIDGVKITSDTQYTFINVNTNHSIRASFAINTYSITSSAGPHGAIAPTPSATVNYRGSQHFNITPNTGYHVDSLIIDGVKIASDTQYTFDNVTLSHSIRASFAINTYSITSSAGAHGTISPTPSASVNYDGSLHFSIKPNTGYHVDSLIIDGVTIASDTQYTFTNVSSDHTIRATFTINIYTITSSAGANGTISPTPSATVTHGGNAHFSIAPISEYHVDSLIIDGVKIVSDTQYTFTNVIADHTIRATFAINTYSITSSAGANGTISPAPAAVVNSGGNQHFSIAPSTGYHVDSLLIDGTPVTPDTQYTFSGVVHNHTIRATFAIDKFLITSTAGANGTISPTPEAIVNYGASQRFRVIPNTGYHVDSLIVDDAQIASDTQYTFSGVVSPHAIRATFAINIYTITSSAGAHGTISPIPTVSVLYGGSQRYSMVPDAGYLIDSMIIDGEWINPDTQYTFTGVAGNHTIRATFAFGTYAINSTAGAHGVIMPTPRVYANPGDSKHFSITPNTGYHVDSLIIDGARIATDTQYTFIGIANNHSIRTTFAINTYSITSSAGANGAISPTPSATVNYGGSQHFSIKPNTGYHADSLFIDGAQIVSDTQYTFTNVISGHAIRVTFAINLYTLTSSAGANGTISPAPSVMVNYGGSQHFSIMPDAHYHVDSLFIDRVLITSDTQYTFTGVAGNHTIRATFTINTFTISADSVSGSGVIRKNPNQVVYNYGTVATLTAYPDTGWQFDRWGGDTTSTDSILSFTVTKNRFITAIFKVQPLYLTTLRTATYESWSTAIDKQFGFNAIKRINDKTDFSLTLSVPYQSNGTNVIIAFSGPSSGYVYYSGTDIVIDSFQNVRIKTFTFNPPLSPGVDMIDIVGRSFIGKGLLSHYAWDITNQPIVPVWGSRVLLWNYLIPRLPLPNLHNVGEELFPAGAMGGVPPVFTRGLLIGLPDSKNSVLMPTYADVKRSLMAGRSTYHSTGSSCLSFRRRARNYPPAKTQNNFFANALILKLNIAASIAGKMPYGLGELTYSDPGNPADPLNGKSVGKISLIADTALSCGTLGSVNATNEQINVVLKKINSAFESFPIDTVSFGVQTVLTGAKSLVGCNYLRLTVGAVPLSLANAGKYFNPLPNEYQLYQNYPNPFNPTTRIEFNLPYASFVTLKIYNILGQEVISLLDHEQMDGGTQTIDFNGSNLASGVYFYRINAQSQNGEGNEVQFVKNRKMVLIK
ncbi:MAG: T9SS type A sorting domain-containing protein [Bacteroidota bacterium]